MKQKKESKKSLKNFWGTVVAVAVALAFVLPGAAMFINDNTFDNTLINISPASWSVNHKATSPFDTRAIEWDVTLDFNESSGKIDQVVFGEAPDANDGPPPDNYDEPKPPPPVQPYIRGWFDDDLPVPYNYLMKDYRQYPDVDKMWDLYVRWKSSSSNLTNVTISWNTSEFDGCEYNSVVLMRYDPFDEEWDFAADMLTEEEYRYSPYWFYGQWLTDHFQINATGGFENNPPYEPSNPSPENDTVDVFIDADLSWTGGDPNPGDTVTYDIYFGTTSPPPLVAPGQSGTTYDPGTMNYGTEYYWQIIAWDDHGAYSVGPVWSFTTEEEPNNPPYTPHDPDPENGSTGVSIYVDLSWVGGDPDLDPVDYDVYFGTSSPPPQVVSNQSSTIYNPGTLDYFTTYYWQIVAWDNHGASAEGPIWSFTTEEEPEPNLDCDGSLSWTDVTPGDTVTGSFTVSNVGDSGSLLDWEIDSYPTDWGTWTFSDMSGTDLTPEDGPYEIDVTVVAPDEQETTFTGEIVLVNSEDPGDTCTIDVTLVTPVNQQFAMHPLFQRIFERFPNAFPILRHLIGL